MIAIIDYGMGNLRSVSKGFEAVGATVKVTHDLHIITTASALVLPGVGAFARGMENLTKLNVIPVLCDAVKANKPFLGICLGMQLLFSESEEHGIHKGLDFIPGKVKKFTSSLKIPHMGWNQIEFKIKDAGVRSKNKTYKIFEGIPEKSYFYFVHSYYVVPDDPNIVTGTTEYGIEFSSAIAKDNVWAVQFHPEKSADLGLKILKNFLKIAQESGA
jgi:glutamine amidotransferase